VLNASGQRIANNKHKIYKIAITRIKLNTVIGLIDMKDNIIYLILHGNIEKILNSIAANIIWTNVT